MVSFRSRVVFLADRALDEGVIIKFSWKKFYMIFYLPVILPPCTDWVQISKTRFAARNVGSGANLKHQKKFN